jgi:hypothetical protein
VKNERCRISLKMNYLSQDEETKTRMLEDFEATSNCTASNIKSTPIPNHISINHYFKDLPQLLYII